MWRRGMVGAPEAWEQAGASRTTTKQKEDKAWNWKVAHHKIPATATPGSKRSTVSSHRKKPGKRGYRDDETFITTIYLIACHSDSEYTQST